MPHAEKSNIHSSSGQRGSYAPGRFQISEMAELQFEDGTTVSGPADGISLSAKSAAVTAGDIIDIACMIFPKLCAPKDPDGGGGGGGSGCYKISLPDGTTITICPGKGSIA